MPLATEQEIQSAYRGQKLAGDYVAERFVAPLMAMLHERQVAAVNRVLREERPGRTLEVAPGPGRITREICPRMSARGASGPQTELVCLEYNEGMIAEGRAASGPEVKWVQGNAFELPFGQEFDALYSFRFVRHFHREDRGRLYAQFRKVLQPGGWLVLDAVNEAVSGPLRKANPDDYKIYDKLYRDENELREELKAEGFEVVRLEKVQRWFPLQCRAQVLLGPRSATLCRWTIEALEWLSRGPSLEWIVTARRAE
jgi:SAM-dependent methyltransferase